MSEMARVAAVCGSSGALPCASGQDSASVRSHGFVFVSGAGFSGLGQRKQFLRLTSLCVAAPVHSWSSLVASEPGQELVKSAAVEMLWLDFFADPSEWWDNRFNKKFSHQPDFRHKLTRKELWLSDRSNPPWVHDKLAAFTEGQLSEVEKLWVDFFADPSQWWDKRFGKKNAKSPDFRRKGSKEGLWIKNEMNPSWVKDKLASKIEDGTLFDSGLSASYTWMDLGWNRDSFSDLRQLEKALQSLDDLHQQGIRASINSFLPLLVACKDLKALAVGKKVQGYAKKMEYEANPFIGTALINMFSNCDSMVDVHETFGKLLQPDTFSYTAIISACVKHGQHQEAVRLFQEMVTAGWKPSKHIYISVVKACASVGVLKHGQFVHNHIVVSGMEIDVFLGSSVIDMYVKCGSVADARQMFDAMPERNVVSWNCMIAGYAQHGPAKEAFQLYRQMQLGCLNPDQITFVHVLKACVSLKDLEYGKQIHTDAKRLGLDSNCFVESALVDMYAKCGSLEDARLVFSNATNQSLVTWNAMIAGYVQHGLAAEAFTLLGQMQERSLKPNQVSFVNMLKGCQSKADLELGKQIHEAVKMCGFAADVYVASALVGMYGRAGKLHEARLAFAQIRNRNLASWNALIKEYMRNGYPAECCKLLKQMQKEGVEPSEVTFITILKACANAGALDRGKAIHEKVRERGLISSLIMRSSLVDMYVNCGCVQSARQVFDQTEGRNNIIWNTMISGYGQHGPVEEAFHLFQKMQQEGLSPDEVTYVHLLQACASARDLDRGRQIHSDVIKSWFSTSKLVACAIVDFYVKCGQLEDAMEAFATQEHSIETWSALITGFVQHQYNTEAISLFRQMCDEGLVPSPEILKSVLKACSRSKALEDGRRVHREAIAAGLELDTYVGNALVDMYGQCGSISEARQLFERLPINNGLAWETRAGRYKLDEEVVQCSV